VNQILVQTFYQLDNKLNAIYAQINIIYQVTNQLVFNPVLMEAYYIFKKSVNKFKKYVNLNLSKNLKIVRIHLIILAINVKISLQIVRKILVQIYKFQDKF